MNNMQDVLLKAGLINKKRVDIVNKKKYEEQKQRNLKERNDRTGNEIIKEVKKKFGI